MIETRFGCMQAGLGNIELQYSHVHGPNVRSANRLLSVTPSSPEAEAIVGTTLYYANTLVEAELSGGLSQDERITLTALKAISGRLRGRTHPGQARPPVEPLGVRLTPSETDLTIEAMRLALLTRRAAAADLQDEHIISNQALLNRVLVDQQRARGAYVLPEPPTEYVAATSPKAAAWMEAQEARINEMKRSKRDEQITLGDQDSRVAAILKELGITPLPERRDLWPMNPRYRRI